jgi:nitrate reductase NapE component
MSSYATTFSQIERRDEVITFLCGAAAAWPLVALARRW